MVNNTEYQERLWGTIPTFETRRESHFEISKDKQKRYDQIIEILKIKGPLTAKEIASCMCNLGHIPTSERNFVSPRLTELMKTGIVDQIGKKKCNYTGKTVTVFKLRSD